MLRRRSHHQCDYCHCCMNQHDHPTHCCLQHHHHHILSAFQFKRNISTWNDSRLPLLLKICQWPFWLVRVEFKAVSRRQGPRLPTDIQRPTKPFILSVHSMTMALDITACTPNHYSKTPEMAIFDPYQGYETPQPWPLTYLHPDFR